MIKTEGIILRKIDSNEVDNFLIAYTKDLGKIKISAKGTKKVESKLRYSVEPITYVQLILVQGKNFLILKDAVIKNQFLGIKKDLEKLKIVREIINIIDEAIAGEEKDEEIWKLILGTIRDLNMGENMGYPTCLPAGTASHITASYIKDDFQKQLIELLGYDSEHIKKVEDIY